MPFDVYPDEPGNRQAKPLNIPQAPSADVPKTITQISAPDTTNFPQYAAMMFIRVAMVGGTTTPTFQLQAGTGAPVTLVFANPPQSQTINSGIPATLSNYAADAEIQAEDPAVLPNVYRIQVGLNATAALPWQLIIGNNDTTQARDFTWVVADNLAETAQPWIDVTSPIPDPVTHEPVSTLAFDVLVGDQASDHFQVANKGTGSLDVTALSPALSGAFSVSTALPLTVPPGTTKPLTVAFAAPAAPPPPDGVTAATVTLTTSPADTTAGTVVGHNQQGTIAATTGQLEVVLLLDDSGSMSWDPYGTPLAAGSMSSRWNELLDATSHFLDYLGAFGNNHGGYGIARFPAGDPNNSSTFDIVPFTAIPPQSSIGSAQSAIKAVTPTDNTPLADGLDRVLTNATSYFSTDTLSVAADRRWLILMSDGAQNSGHLTDPVAVVNSEGGLTATGKRIEIYAVAYGIPGYPGVNPQMMANLQQASLNGGLYSSVGTGTGGTTGTALATALKKAIQASLQEFASSSDPSAVFLAGQDEARHDVLLTQYDDKAAFALYWNTPDAARLQLTLLSPGCEQITSENAGHGDLAGVTFRGGNRYQSYFFDPGFLANQGGQSRYGTWTMVVTPGLEYQAQRADTAGVYENYTYDVMAESTLRMRLTLDRAAYYAGDPVVVSARLTVAGVPVTGASVVLSTTAPAQSLANWLAGITVPADALAQAAQRLTGQDATPLVIKTLGAEIAGLHFGLSAQRGNLVMTDPGGLGTYQATYTDTSVPEQRTLYVTAIGLTPDGVSFRREGQLEVLVQVRPDPAATILAVQYGAAGTATATVFPRDRFGNVLLIEPLPSSSLQLVATGAQFTGPMVSNLDGSYTRPLHITAGAASVGVQFNGQDVIPPRPLPPLADLHYVDEVIGFDAGAIASANQHGDPQAVLGSIDGKPADTFVALGAGGRLGVAIRESVIVAAGGDDDITVFVHPEDDLRS
ncbi:MAG: vWA domain-containing protein, partial [Streptosporangiaceae bacterium]